MFWGTGWMELTSSRGGRVGHEGLAMVDTEVVACAGGGGAVSSWNGSDRLMLNHSWWSDLLLREVDPTQRIWNNTAMFI